MKTKSASAIIESLDSSRRMIAYSPEVEDSYKKKFKYVAPDLQLEGFVMDEVAMTSDCYVLYAIAYFGVATFSMIVDFLRMKNRTGSSLSLIKKDGLEPFLKQRLRVLKDRGYTFQFSYEIGGELVSLYGVSEEAYVLIRQRLEKVTFSLNHGIATKTVRRILDWAAAGYVGARLMQSPRVSCELGRTYFNKKIKNCFLPFEFLSMGTDGSLYYVGGFSGNWERDPNVQTQRDHDEWLKVQADLLYCYLNYRSEKGTPVAVVVVRDRAALENVAGVIARAEGLLACVDRIVFTGEGAFRDAEAEGFENVGEGVFIQMRVEGNQVVFRPVDSAIFV